MQYKRTPIRLLVGICLCVFHAWAQAGTCAGIAVGPLSNLNGFVPFPSDNLWNTDISNYPVDANSANYLSYIGSAPLHPDFGSGLYNGSTMGIPYQVVAPGQAKTKVMREAYANESDPGAIPLPQVVLIEGYPKAGNGDRHVLILDGGGCWLYELYNAQRQNGKWSADSVAIWDMTIDDARPYTWTSADAAGLPIFPGLVRYDEASAGAINHALRFTVPVTQQAFTAPASHWASAVTDANAPPMGLRLRLKASVDISGYSAIDQTILKALKKYGMIVADNGSALFVSGAPDSRWDNDDLGNLKGLITSDFEVVQAGPIYTAGNTPTGMTPQIAAFSANAKTVKAGSPVTLSWSVSGAIYNIITPLVGPVRGSSVVVTPTVTTTYTLYSTNRFGRSTSTLTVTVQ